MRHARVPSRVAGRGVDQASPVWVYVSWHFQVTSLASIYLCIALWIRAKTVDQEERGNAERRALFVGALAAHVLADRRRGPTEERLLTRRTSRLSLRRR